MEVDNWETIMRSQRRRRTPLPVANHRAPDPPQDIPEWLEDVRLKVEREAPLMRVLMMRAISAVLRFHALSEASVVNATSAATDLAVLVRALSSGELLDDLKSVEPLAPAFIRGIEAKRKLIDETGGVLTAEKVAEILGITRQAVDKRRRAGTLIGLTTGRYGYRYPVWQFTESGTVPGLEHVLSALASHDEWMQVAFLTGKNPRLNGRTPVETLKAGKLDRVLNAAHVYGEHGAA
jgi:hypothetical protein